ncbi:MAG: ATP-dependent helicase [Anaerolineaceae bacterium]|jgi:DNA helicase-2/ATP-dependent DNA helicase PcrA|nr:ATP-dependent helicase [Anaerolineaceae bacterium]
MSSEPRLRTSQEEVMTYRTGLMGISAVPGSGKTWTLSNLAVRLILSTDLEPDQEILVVTFSNSAADNFSNRIGEQLRANGLIEGFGYRVRTLHGLANDIIHERPELVGLSNEFGIIDEAETNEIMKDLAAQAMENHFDFLTSLISEDINEKKRESIIKTDFPDFLMNLAKNWINTVKDKQITISQLEQWLSEPDTNPLMSICLGIYRGYQAALNYRGAIDFDDLIRYALECLRLDSDLRTQLHHRWPFILEDESQDSSKLQQEILTTLVGEDGNWVRVGDPNQAIFESFTTADPNLLKTFVSRDDVRSVDLPVSGRSAPSIIDLANSMIDWVQTSHPNYAIRDALSEPFIQPTPPGDPQTNPTDLPDSVVLFDQPMTSDQELVYLSKAIKAWLKGNPDSTVAVLTYLNKRASDIVNFLKTEKIEVSDVLMKVPEPTRLSAGAVVLILKSLFDPLNPGHLARCFEVFFRHYQDNPDLYKLVKSTSKLIRTLENTEDYLYPDEKDWIQNLEDEELNQNSLEMLKNFRWVMRRWHAAMILPMDQLVLVVAQDLVLENSEIAIIHKLSGFIKSLLENNPHWTDIDVLDELIGISKNNRGFATFSQKEDGFDPDNYKGKVIVATTHKSKGLEWDKVFLSSANNYDYPGGESNESYTSEKWFITNQRNLEAELLYDLESLRVEHSGGIMLRAYDKQDARNDVARERLRLFYVGITRAKKSLNISWNTGTRNNLRASLPFQYLSGLVNND